MPVTELRCSSLPRFCKCQQSEVRPSGEMVAMSESTAADIGTETHRRIASLLRGNVVAEASCEDVEILTLTAISRLKRLNIDTMREIASEVPGVAFLGDLVLTGMEDLECWDNDRRALTIDFKSTRDLGADYTDQLMGYTVLRRERMRRDEQQLPSVYWLVTMFLRDSTIRRGLSSADADWDILEVDNAALDEWTERLIKKAAHADTSPYNKGHHCHFCRRYMTCPAYLELLKMVNSVAGLPDDATLGQTLVASKELVSRCKEVSDYAEQLHRQTGEIVGGYGVVTVNKQEIVPSIETVKSLSELIGDAWPQAIRISQTGIKEACGGDSKTSRRVLDALKERGLVTVNATEQFRRLKDE